MTDPLDRLEYRGRWPDKGLAWSDPGAPELEAFDVALPMAEVDAAIAEMRGWNARLTKSSVETPATRRRPGPTTANPAPEPPP